MTWLARPDHESMRILQGSGKFLAQFGDGFSTWSMTMVSIGAFAGVSFSPIPRTEVRIEEYVVARDLSIRVGFFILVLEIERSTNASLVDYGALQVAA
jgi:hypothetical protein